MGLEDRWRDCFQTILLSLISADREPPEELQVTSALRGSGIFQNRQRLETFSLCTDRSRNLERIRFLSAHDASGCACGGLRVGWKILWDVRFHCSFGSGVFHAQESPHSSVLLPETLLGGHRLPCAWPFLIILWKFMLLHLYLCILWGRNHNSAYCRTRPLLYPGLFKTGIITILQKRKLKFTEARNIQGPTVVSHSQDSHSGLSGSQLPHHAASLEKGVVDMGCVGTKQPPEISFTLKYRSYKAQIAHFSQWLSEISGLTAWRERTRSQIHQILVRPYYTQSTGLCKVKRVPESHLNFLSWFLIWEMELIIPAHSTLWDGFEGALWTKKCFINIRASWMRHFQKELWLQEYFRHILFSHDWSLMCS